MITLLARLGLILALCLGLLIGVTTTANAASPTPACDPPGVEEAASQGVDKASDLLQDAKNEVARAQTTLTKIKNRTANLKRAAQIQARAAAIRAVRSAASKASYALQVYLCAQQLHLFNGPDLGPQGPVRQPGSSPDYPPNYVHPKGPPYGGYRIPCLGPQGQQWEIWSDEVCRGPNGQSK